MPSVSASFLHNLLDRVADMPKNVVVCCDGTANEFKTNRTNVVKLFSTLDKDPTRQAAWYHPGVGTMAPPGVRTRVGSALLRAAGMAFGYGLSNDIRDAYTFIANNVEDGDRLYLFGFSRGAYTVRALASLLHMYGLIPRGNDPLVPYIVRMLWAIHSRRKHARAGEADPRLDEYFALARDFKSTYSRPCTPHFVGVWDTVSSVGWFSNPLSLPYTAKNPDITIGRHAVAIDECRAFFRTNTWRPPPDSGPAGPKDLLQVWFPGVHCDVGGGYPEAESGLSKIALKWMLDEAKAAGLLTDDEKVALVLGERGDGFVRPDPNGRMHDSLTPLWRLAEYVPKPHWNGQGKEWRANRGRRRSWPEKPVVHDTAWERDGDYAACLPADAIRLSMARPIRRR